MGGIKRLPWFFFGSLMDIDVLACVVDRSVVRAPGIGASVTGISLQAAILPGFECLQLLDEAYPALKPSLNGEVRGVLADGINDAESERIAFFEGDEFSRQVRTVHLIGKNNVTVDAWVFLAGEGLQFATKSWDFTYWQHHEKAQYLEMAREFMAGYGNATWGELDQQWQAARHENNLNNS